MKPFQLRRRLAEEEDHHEAIAGQMLEIFLVGLGAAAALMIIYSVLPKLGSAGGGEAVILRPATRAELRRQAHPTTGTGEPSLTLIQVQAPPHSGFSPADVTLPACPHAVMWTEGTTESGWQRSFVSREPLPAGVLRLLCHLGPSAVEFTRLTITAHVDGRAVSVVADYRPAPAPGDGQPHRQAGTFLLSPPPAPHAGRATIGNDGLPPNADPVQVLAIHPDSELVPVSGCIEKPD